MVNVTWRLYLHESQEKGLYEGKAELAKLTLEKSGLCIYFVSLTLPISYFRVPMVVLCFHEHLTHGRSLGCGGVISEHSQMPSL